MRANPADGGSDDFKYRFLRWVYCGCFSFIFAWIFFVFEETSMKVEKEYGLLFIKSRNYVFLKFMELELAWQHREPVFLKDQLPDGNWCLVAKENF